MRDLERSAKERGGAWDLSEDPARAALMPELRAGKAQRGIVLEDIHPLHPPHPPKPPPPEFFPLPPPEPSQLKIL